MIEIPKILSRNCPSGFTKARIRNYRPLFIKVYSRLFFIVSVTKMCIIIVDIYNGINKTLTIQTADRTVQQTNFSLVVNSGLRLPVVFLL